METVFNNVLPVFAVLALGAVIKRLGLAGDDFFRAAERLVYFVFFPALLFYKIGAPAGGLQVHPGQVAAALTVATIIFGLSLAAIFLMGLTPAQAGSFAQCSFRFNTYIGMAVITTSLGPDGVTSLGLLIGLVIPYLNLLAVGSLIWFGAGELAPGKKALAVARAVIVNPLILACLAGMAYGAWLPPWPRWVDNTLSLLAVLSLPLALIAIGGSLNLAKLKGHFKPAMASTGLKLVVQPLLGWGLLSLLGVSGLAFQVGMIYFALPTSTSAYILSSQLGGDTDLAAATIVLCTLLSFVSLSVVLLLIS